jgi:hypothetical protein
MTFQNYSKGYRTKPVFKPLFNDLDNITGGNYRLSNMYGGSKKSSFVAKLMRQQESKYGDDIDKRKGGNLYDPDGNLDYKIDRSKLLVNRMDRQPTSVELAYGEGKWFRDINPNIRFLPDDILTQGQRERNRRIVEQRTGEISDRRVERQRQRREGVVEQRDDEPARNRGRPQRQVQVINEEDLIEEENYEDEKIQRYDVLAQLHLELDEANEENDVEKQIELEDEIDNLKRATYKNSSRVSWDDDTTELVYEKEDGSTFDINYEDKEQDFIYKKPFQDY